MANQDINVIPLHRQAGKELSSLPGLHIANPPKRAARGRDLDQLLLLLSFNERAFSDERLAELMARLESVYYEKPGSTTSAMRELIEELNGLILNLNQRHAGNRPEVIGSISVVVVRGDHLFLAQSGSGHMFVIMPRKVEYLHDEQAAGRGLGSEANAPIFFAQMPLAEGYKLLLTAELPDSWNADTFKKSHNQPLHSAQRFFLEDAGEEVQGLLAEYVSGSGKVTMLRAPGEISLEKPAAGRLSQPVTPARQPHAERPHQEPVAQAEDAAAVAAKPGRPRQAQRTPPPVETPRPQKPHKKPLAETAVADHPPFEELAQEKQPSRTARQAKEAAAAVGPALLNILQRGRTLWSAFLRGMKKLFQRLLPGEEMLKIPTSYMAFIAVAVPLVVVTIAALVYAQVGRNQQFELYYSQAQSLAQMAAAETDVAASRQNWQAALEQLDLAEGYLVTPESEALRAQTLAALDQLDNISRLEFKPAIAGTLAGSIKIRRMIATGREIYMLDIASDSVIRAKLTGTSYEMDPQFRCGAGPYGSLIVQGLVDIDLLPENPDGASLIALDQNGNLLYCFPEAAPSAVSLTPPDSNWGKPIAMTLENDRLYILDEQLNMVWFYNASEEGDYQFRDAPFFFFADEVPNMKDTIDFAIDNEQLYLLYLNGQTTTCTYSALKAAPTSCTVPTMYNDSRPGRQPGVVIEDAIFYQIQHSQPPEPSLFYLDPVSRSIYHFSLKLYLTNQYRPQPGLEEGLATAFAVSPTRAVFIALDNKVYMAYLP